MKGETIISQDRINLKNINSGIATEIALLLKKDKLVLYNAVKNETTNLLNLPERLNVDVHKIAIKKNKNKSIWNIKIPASLDHKKWSICFTLYMDEQKIGTPQMIGVFEHVNSKFETDRRKFKDIEIVKSESGHYGLCQDDAVVIPCLFSKVQHRGAVLTFTGEFQVDLPMNTSVDGKTHYYSLKNKTVKIDRIDYLKYKDIIEVAEYNIDSALSMEPLKENALKKLSIQEPHIYNNSIFRTVSFFDLAYLSNYSNERFFPSDQLIEKLENDEFDLTKYQCIRSNRFLVYQDEGFGTVDLDGNNFKKLNYHYVRPFQGEYTLAIKKKKDADNTFGDLIHINGKKASFDELPRNFNITNIVGRQKEFIFNGWLVEANEAGSSKKHLFYFTPELKLVGEFDSYPVHFLDGSKLGNIKTPESTKFQAAYITPDHEVKMNSPIAHLIKKGVKLGDLNKPYKNKEVQSNIFFLGEIDNGPAYEIIRIKDHVSNAETIFEDGFLYYHVQKEQLLTGKEYLYLMNTIKEMNTLHWGGLVFTEK